MSDNTLTTKYVLFCPVLSSFGSSISCDICYNTFWMGELFALKCGVFLAKKIGSETFSLPMTQWWGKVDSNHRRHCQQIYSLSPLATREFPHILFSAQYWSWWTDSNPRPADYKSAALPTELHQHFHRPEYNSKFPSVCQHLFCNFHAAKKARKIVPGIERRR